MAAPVIQFKRGPAGSIGNALLKAGEPGFTTDRYDFYIGSDGTAANQRFFGSARYWSRETGSNGTGLNFYGNTSNLTNYLTIRGPSAPSGIGTYILPDTSTIIDGYVLSLSGITGQLAWVAPSNVSSLSNTQLSGITTITGYVDNQANNNISGILTASNAVRFTSATDNTLGTTNTGAVQISGGAAIAKNLTVGAALSVGGGGVSVLGIQTNFNGTENTLGTTNTGALQIAGGAAVAKNLTVGAGLSVLGNAFVNGITTVASTVSFTNTAPTITATSTGTLSLFNTNITTVNAFGNANSITVGSATGIATFAGSIRVTNSLRDSSNFAGSNGQFLTVTASGIGWTTISGVQAGSISTATRSLYVDTYTTGDTGTFYPTFVSTTGSTVGTGTAIYVDANISIDAATNTLTLGGNLNANGGTVNTTSGIGTLFGTPASVAAFGSATSLQLAATTGITTIRNKLIVGGNLEVDGNNIQSSTGANVITLSTTDATFNGAVTIAGNLTVNGTTTQVNTTELQVYDRTITLGVQTGTTPVNTTWDLGVMMQYGDAGIARTAGVIWEYANRRFQFASNSDNPTAGISTANPQITVTSFAPIEIGALWINDAGGSYAGVSSVISYLGAGQLYSGSPADRYLHNVTIDAGTFS